VVIVALALALSATAETVVSRDEWVSAMRARGLASQRVEARIGCKILNPMAALGMPDCEMIG
jgi:hypothetical protein